MIEQRVPTVGESITEVTVANWHKKDGDMVKADEILCELESDKATFEVTAESAGVLRIVAQSGQTIAIGAVICRIEASGAPVAPPAVPLASTAVPATPAAPATPVAAVATGQVVDMVVPTVGESITEVTIGNWAKKDGDSVKAGELLCEIESDKATFELTAEKNGTLRIVAKEGTTLAIGALICRIEVSTGGSVAAAPTQPVAQTPVTAAKQEAAGYASGHPSPAASKILAEKGITTAEVQGSGVGGRITKADADAAQKTVPSAEAPKAKAPEAAPAVIGGRQQQRQRMSSLRRTIARRLVAVKNETAMLTTFNEVDMQPIKDIRNKYKDTFKEKYGIGLGFMSFFVKAVCVALKQFPAVNAYIEGEEIVFNDFCDVSIAVSTEKGLVVPVIRNAETMSFDAIEKEIMNLAKRARDGKLTIPEMTGGTFTITNGGTFGSMLSTPIINAPQSAILGMHNIVDRAVVVNGQIVVRPVMYVALSYDHRIIDGKDSVSFLVRVKELLEDPTRLLLGV